MNVNTALRRRKLGLSGRVEIDFAVDRIRLKEVMKLTSNVNPNDEDQKAYGPLACVKLSNGIMAVANEDGYINLLNTKNLKNLQHWLAHDNAVFDVKASPDQKTIMTASGDTTIKVWDVSNTKEVAAIEKAHHSSIKSISIYDSNIVASGSRDGSIKIHDLRLKEKTVIVIRDAHRNHVIAKPRRISAKTDPVSCVTNVVFDPNSPRIYSTGANDATIKLWDIRRHTQTNRPRRGLDGQLYINQPYLQVHHPSRGVHCGYSHLLLSSFKVYAACSDNKIYCYDNFGSDAEPVKFTGYHHDTYLRLAVMDDRFLLSGSKGGGAMLWTLGNKRSSMYYPETTKHPIGQLKPDENDKFDTNVIETDWDSLSIFTFRDDRLVCKWTMQHVLESERKRLIQNAPMASIQDDITIEMSDIIDVNVLRPNNRLSNVQVSA